MSIAAFGHVPVCSMFLTGVACCLFPVTTPSKPSDRVLRPMIVAKQLDLPDGLTGEYVSQQTPRTNLTKELEKYNRPPVDFAIPVSRVPATIATVTIKKEVLHMPERPNILSKRPHHFKPQPRYDPTNTGPLNLSIKGDGDKEALSPMMEDQTLDLSIKKDFGVFNMDSTMMEEEDEHQDEPMDFSKKTLDSQQQGTVRQIQLQQPVVVKQPIEESLFANDRDYSAAVADHLLVTRPCSNISSGVSSLASPSHSENNFSALVQAVELVSSPNIRENIK